jgi:hypothetical protein
MCVCVHACARFCVLNAFGRLRSQLHELRFLINMEIILNFTMREQTSYDAGRQSKTFVANKLLAAI